jgi:hypothetical protein
MPRLSFELSSLAGWIIPKYGSVLFYGIVLLKLFPMLPICALQGRWFDYNDNTARATY